MVRWIGALIFGTLAGTSQSQNLKCVDLSDVPPSGNVRFAEDVLPIIEDELWQCTDCHGAAGGLAIDQGTASHQELFCADTQSSVPQPPAKRIVPGAPLESWFYLRLACDDVDDESFRMPRFGIPLASAELRLIYDWIAQGAASAETIFTSRFDDRGFCP